MAARLRTLPAAIAPVLVGTSLALGAGHFEALAFVAALLGAVFIQVGTNLSNDYSDARRGADTEDRLGPVRVTAGGLVPPSQVLIATYVSFGLAVLCGIYLVAVAGPELLAVGAASILAGVLYTGGPRPYGYEGLGEVFVFLFFGIVAVTGSYFVQVQSLPWQAFVCAVPVGLLASAILVVNNVRDIDTDRRAGKRTLAVRLGRARDADAVRGDGVRRLRDRPGAVAARLDERMAAAALGRAAAGPPPRRDRADANRRALAQRCARRHRGPAADLLPVVRRRDPRERRRGVVRLELERRTLRLSEPLATSYGSVRERELVIVALLDRDGVAGYGEAAPLQPYDGVSLEQVLRALESYRPAVALAEQMNGAELLEACRSIEDLPAALAAIDIALWDRAGRRAQKPIAALLSDDPAASVPVNATLSALDRAGAAEQAARAVQEGFTCLKVKVGVGDDPGRVAAARAGAGPRAALRLDANGAWSVEQAVSSIEALSPAGLELVEEPTHGLQGMSEVRDRVAVRVAIDETAAEHGALTAGVADAVCLKISRCGGLAGLLAAAALVRTTGAEVYLASTFDGPIGIAAALHAAAALASRGPVPHCGLATLGLFEDLDSPLTVGDGEMPVPTEAGLGVGPF